MLKMTRVACLPHGGCRLLAVDLRSQSGGGFVGEAIDVIDIQIGFSRLCCLAICPGVKPSIFDAGCAGNADRSASAQLQC